MFTSHYCKFNQEKRAKFHQKWPCFVENMTIILMFFSVHSFNTVHLQNANTKFHKVVQRRYSVEVENVYISVR